MKTRRLVEGESDRIRFLCDYFHSRKAVLQNLSTGGTDHGGVQAAGSPISSRQERRGQRGGTKIPAIEGSFLFITSKSKIENF